MLIALLFCLAVFPISFGAPQPNSSDNESAGNAVAPVHMDAHDWSRLGVESFNRGDYNRSIVCFNLSLNESPDRPDPWNNMAVAYLALGNYSLALSCMDQAARLSGSEEAIIWNNRGAVLYRMGELREAEECFNRSIGLGPEYSPAWNNLGAVLAKRDMHERALEHYSKAIDCDLYNKVAWSNKGRSFTILGRYPEAWDSLHNALILDKNYTPAWINAAEYYRRIGDANNYQGSIIIIRMQGYNGSLEAWPAEAEAVLMKDKSRLSDAIPAQAPAPGCCAFCIGMILAWMASWPKKSE